MIGKTHPAKTNGTSRNCRLPSRAAKLPANDSALFPFRFIGVRPREAQDRRQEQVFEVPK
jgi:hypothetical protein